MKRAVLFAAALAVVLLLRESDERTDVAELEPIEVVRFSQVGDQVCVETDTRNIGLGNHVWDAVADLKKTTAGEVFLDTADYLLIDPKAEQHLSQLKDILRPGCMICMESGVADMEKVASFLRIHKPNLTLLEYVAGVKTMPVLISEEGRMELVQQ